MHTAAHCGAHYIRQNTLRSESEGNEKLPGAYGMEISGKKLNRLLWDISGAFGDAGVLFPMAIALIVSNGFSPTAIFLMAGLFYLASAFWFKITMPVQPLKAMFAIAVAAGLGTEVINAAGIVMGGILLLLSLTGLAGRLGAIFPLSVIRGIQLGLGLMLIKTSLGFMETGVPLALVTGAMLIVLLVVFKKTPPLIPILLLGIVLSFPDMRIEALGPAVLTPFTPTLDNLWIGTVQLVIPQLALTFGNAVVATEATGRLLYGKRAAHLNFRSIPLSMGVANIVSGFLGGAPMCHGSGGLTAHYKFGARSERSGYIIGGLLVILALVFGKSALSIVSAFPTAILGVLLCYVGIEHALFIRDILRDRTSLAIALTVAALGFVTSNLTAGFLVGGAVYYLLAGVKACKRS